MKISEFIATVVDNLPKRKEGASVINPLNHFMKLVESHGMSLDTNINVFFTSLSDVDAFFDTDHMPKSWSIRTYAASANTLRDIIASDKVLAILNDIKVDSNALLCNLQNIKKRLLSTYKRERRETQKETRANTIDDEEAPHQIILDEDIVHNNAVAAKTKINDMILSAIHMLDKYMQNETDNFKVVFLDVIKETLTKATKALAEDSL